MKVSRASVIAGSALLYSNVATAANSTDSLKSETSPIAKNAMAYYTTNLTTKGLLEAPYSWSEAATLFSTMINYAFYTGDTTYSDDVASGLVAQIGDNNDFQTSDAGSESTSGQALWALACMTAVETGFQNPSDSSKTGWLGFAENVWQEQATRWNSSAKSDCKGGLNAEVAGGGDVDAFSAGAFLALSARLARYTGNSTFSSQAETVYSWATSSGLVSNGVVNYALGSSCSSDSVNTTAVSANAAQFLVGAAHMYNLTSGDSTWKDRLTNVLTSTIKTFAPDGDGILIEVSCERSMNCSTPTLSYKAILASALTDTIKVAPFTASNISEVLQSSADAAVKSCNSTSDSTDGTCGTQWTWGEFDNLTGLGQELAALSVMQGLLVNSTGEFKTTDNGGATATSTGSSSGSGSGTGSSPSSSSTKKSGAEKVMVGCTFMLGFVAIVFAGLL